MTPVEDYRDLILAELEARRKRKSTYSARAFARDLGLTPAYLTHLFAHRRNLSEKRAAEILDTLNWDDSHREKFWLLYRIARAGDTSMRTQYTSALREVELIREPRTLDQDEFQVISQWYHFALVELIKTEGSHLNSQALADRLQISVDDVRSALDRLIRLNLIVKTESGFKAVNDFYSAGGVPSEAMKQHHEQHLKLAQAALWQQAFGQRDFSGITVATDPELLPEASRMIQSFRRRLMRYLESGKKTQVYRLNVQLFKLDHDKGTSK